MKTRMKDKELEARLGDIENLFRDRIRESSKQAYAKRTITNEKTWIRAVDSSGDDYRNMMDKLLNQLSELYEDIVKWPEEEVDE